MHTIEILLLNGQPVTCPKCSARTDFYEFVHENEEYQIHFCKAWDCGFVFLAMEDEEFL